MTTTLFPILKLPLIPLEIIIEQLNFLDLVHISMKSSKLKGILQLLRLPVQTLHVFVTERFYGIKILQNRNSSFIDACDSLPVDTYTEAVKIQGEPMHIWKDGRNALTVKSDSAKLATLETITKHVWSFSRVAESFVTFGDVGEKIRSVFIWQLTTQLKELNICFNNGSHVPISLEDLTFLLEGISTERLLLKVSCPGFKYQRPIRHPAIYIKCSRWIDFYKFSLGPETISANFYEQKVSNAVLNRLIKDWTEGKNPKLREVLFIWNDTDPESLAMAREHKTQPPRSILPNRNIDQLKRRCINYSIKFRFQCQSVHYEVCLSVEEDLGLNGVYLEDQN